MRTKHILISVMAAALLLALPGGPAAAAQETEPLPAPVQVSPPDRSYVGTGSFLLTWTPISGAASYVIEVYPEDLSGTVYRFTSHDNQHTVFDLPPNDSYFWVVRAIHPSDERLNSGWSPYPLWAFTTASEPFVPLTPEVLWASEGTFNDYVELNIHFSVRAESYKVTRTDLTTEEVVDFTVTFPTVHAGLYNDTDVILERRYSYTVQACNSAGCSAPLDPPSVGWAGACLPEIPEAPVWRSPQPNSVFLFEPDQSMYFLEVREMPGITEFQTQVYEQQTGKLVLDEIGGGSQLMQEAGYFRWRVRALDPVQGCPAGHWSALWNYRAIAGPPPATPVNLRASQGAHASRIELTWDTPASVTLPDEHLIYWSLTPELDEEQYYSSGEAEAFTDDNDLEAGRVYYYWVKACQHTRGCSEPSQRAAGWLRTSSQTVLQQILYFPRVGR